MDDFGLAFDDTIPTNTLSILPTENGKEDNDISLDGLNIHYCFPSPVEPIMVDSDNSSMPRFDLGMLDDYHNKVDPEYRKEMEKRRVIVKFTTNVLLHLIPADIRKKYFDDVWFLYHLVRQILYITPFSDYLNTDRSFVEPVVRRLRKLWDEYIQQEEMLYDEREGELEDLGNKKQSGRLVVIAMKIAKASMSSLMKDASSPESPLPIETKKRIHSTAVTDETIEEENKKIKHEVLPFAKKRFISTIPSIKERLRKNKAA